MSRETGTRTGTAGHRAAVGARRLRGVRAFAFDLDGTVYLQDRLLPGARALVERLVAGGIPHLFATNNSSRSGAAYVEHLRALGVPVDRERVLTSNDVAASHLRGEGLSRPFLVATAEVVEEYRGHGLEPSRDRPDCVLLTFDTSLSYDKLRTADRLIRQGLPYLATHPDRVCPTPDGPIPDCGSFIALLQASTGALPRILGKPEGPMAAAVQERLGAPASAIAFVGDRLYTDVRLANRHGFRAVLTLTGEASANDVAAADDRPEVVVESLLELLELLEHAQGPDASAGAA